MTERLTVYGRFARLLLVAAALTMPLWSASAEGAQRKSPIDARSSSLEEAVEQAESAQAGGNYANAADAYAKAVSLDKTVPELWANRGLMEHLAGRKVDAIASFQHAIALKPTLFTAQLFLGVDELEAGNPKQAVICLEHARSLRPADLQAQLALGRAYTAVHEARSAAGAYAAATAIEPNNQNAWYGLGVSSISIIEQDGGTLARLHPDSVWTRALYADDLILQGRVAEAARIYKQVATVGSTTQRALFAAILRRTSEASTTTEQGVLTPQTLDELVVAVNAPSASTLIDCTAAPMAAGQMSCLYLQNQYEATSLAAGRQLRVRPNDPEALFWSAKANESRAVEALAHFEELAPHSAATYVLLGDLDRRRMQPDSALLQYDKALALAPHDPSALLGRAAALLSTGRFDDAIATAGIGLSETPEDPRLNLLTGEALIDRHRFPEAEPFLDRALSAAASKNADASIAALAPRAHALKGRVKAEAGVTDQAISEMALGLSSDQDGSLSFQLSRLYRGAGRTAAARETEAHAKALQAQRRDHAVIAVQGSQLPFTE